MLAVYNENRVMLLVSFGICFLFYFLSGLTVFMTSICGSAALIPLLIALVRIFSVSQHE
jgi:hypothetical protein